MCENLNEYQDIVRNVTRRIFPLIFFLALRMHMRTCTIDLVHVPMGPDPVPGRGPGPGPVPYVRTCLVGGVWVQITAQG